MIRTKPTCLALLLLFTLTLTACQPRLDEAAIQQEILDHGAVIRAAFAAGDVAKITALHHPEVEKALGYNDRKNGRVEVVDGIAETLRHYTLTFVENDVESIFIQGDLAIEQSSFSIRGTPKGDLPAFVFSGRTMVTYIRYADSPTGWATIREMIQPAVE